jgi:hypothetical protein
MKVISLKKKKKRKWVIDLISMRETFDHCAAFFKNVANNITLLG